MAILRKWPRLLLAGTIALSCLLGGIGGVPPVHAEGPADPAPELLPAGTPNGKKILFDNTHGQTAGAADWVIDGAFSDFAGSLANSGYYVKELRKSSPVTYSDLSGYDVVVIGEANIPYKTSEQAALLQYVQNGGSLFFIADHYNADRNKNRWDSSEVFNGYRRGAWTDPAKGMGTEERASAAMQDVASSDWLSANFGIRFRYNAVGDVNATQIVQSEQAFGITAGVSSVAMHAGSTLAVTDPSKAKGIVYLPATTTKWANAVDQGVYAGGGTAEGPFVAVSKVGQGKAGFIGDSSPVEDATPKYSREETGAAKTTYDGFLEQNDAVLLDNMVQWLATKETYTDLTQVSGLQLDQPTSLLAMEDPASSTEPQAEPWAAPAAGYKWWDPSTFKPGSYGYGSTGGGGSGTGDLFISEYVEGSSYNKAIEIYNGTGASVNLTGYTISQSNTGTIISLSGTLASGDVYVVAHSSAASGITSVADLLTASISYNGDDAVTLKKNGTTIDVIGTAGTLFGENKTMVRKSTVTEGSTSYNAAQWDSYASDTFTYLGSHTVQSANQAPTVANPISDKTAAAGSGAVVVDATNTFTDPNGDALTLTASSSNTAAATVSVNGKQVSVTPASAGTSTISVTANDGKGGTVSDSFLMTVTAASTAILDESFESGSKTAYTAGNVTLASGSWYFDNALLGNLSTDRKNGAVSARIKAPGSISMNFNVSGVTTVKVSHALFGSDTGATWKLQKSLDNGSTWIDITGVISSSSTLTEQTVTVNESSSVRLRIIVSGTSGARLNIDDVKIYN